MGRSIPSTHPIAYAATRTGAVDSPPAKLPVRTHQVTVVDGDIMVEESTAAPNLPPGLTAQGHQSQSG